MREQLKQEARFIAKGLRCSAAPTGRGHESRPVRDVHVAWAERSETRVSLSINPSYSCHPLSSLDSKPMLVYHFINERFGLEALRNRRLKIARIMELNDPFEFLAVDLSDRGFRKVIKTTKATLSKTNGILCFSKTWTHPILWGHYADKHKGICLGFEVPRQFLKKVDYVECRFEKPNVLNEAFMKKLLFTKFKHWEYEQEYRTYLQLEDEIDGLYFSDFSADLSLKRVIVGDQSKITRSQIYQSLGSLQNNVEMFKARAGFRSFEVVRNKNEAMWT